MARVTRATVVPGPMSTAEALWFDLDRRSSFLEGFGHLVVVEGDWPAAGARVIWAGPPNAKRPRVAETVQHFEARVAQTVAVEDDDTSGTQTTSFAATSDGQVRVTVALAWIAKDGNGLKDWTLRRHRRAEALRRTLARYRIERLSDLDDERAREDTAP